MAKDVRFQIAYDGEALQSKSMDVKDLAPALIGLGQLVEEANRVLNGNKAVVNLKVVAKTPGSFQIDFNLLQTATDILSGDNVVAALNLYQLLFIGGSGGWGLIKLIRWLRGHRPNQIEEIENGQVAIIFEQQTIIIPSELLELYQDLGVRKATENVLIPLWKPGIDVFEVRKNHEVLERITKNELDYYVAPRLDEKIITESESRTAYSIVSLSFKEDNKWRLNDGIATINATIKDEGFLNKVERNLISFTKGDILICRVKRTQWQTETGLKTEYEVLEVVEHVSAPRQLSFDDITRKDGEE